MSYSAHQKLILDSTLPLTHRFSHLRSCVLNVANLLNQNRSDVIASIENSTGINIEETGNEVQLLTALRCLNEIRTSALHKD